MKKNRFAKSYDVKTFLNKKKSRSGFVSLTLTRTTVNIIVLSVILCLMLPPAFSFVREFKFVNYMIEAGVRDVLPFLRSWDKADPASIAQMVVSGNVSTLFSQKKPEETKKLSPEIPKVNISSESDASQGIEIKNETDYDIDVTGFLSEAVVLKTSNPKVLIMHTHGSESYTPSDKYTYVETGNYRTQDTAFNMIRIGEEIANHLKSKGISVIHDKTINDYPSYNASYNKAEAVIKKYLAEDGDIAFVFDIHRDAVGEGNNIVKFVSDINGKSTAQVMMVCGTDTNLENPAWQENLKLAIHIQNETEKDYPGFLRPLNLRKERFNMHLTTGSILFEIGTNGNTLDEALLSAGILGDKLGDIISDISSK